MINNFKTVSVLCVIVFAVTITSGAIAQSSLNEDYQLPAGFETITKTPPPTESDQSSDTAVKKREDNVPQSGTTGEIKRNIKIFSAGLGNIFYTFKGQTEARDSEIEGAFNDLGISIGLMTAENLLSFRRNNSGMGYFISANTYIGLSPTVYGTKLNKDLGSPKTISQNLNIGAHFYFTNPTLDTYFGISPSLNILFRDLNKSANSPENEPINYAITLGVGFITNITLNFNINPKIAVPINITLGYYPFNFDTFGTDVYNTTSHTVLASLQTGVMLRY